GLREWKGDGVIQLRDLPNRTASNSHAHSLRVVQVSPGHVRPGLPEHFVGAARIHKERKRVRAAGHLRHEVGGEKLEGLRGWVGGNPTIAERMGDLASRLIVIESP